jgi:hypothetical protein
VGERKKEEHTRALARRAAPGSGFGRVNGSPKSGQILAGTRLPFADLCCHFESVTDFTRGILRLATDLVFGTPKTLAVPSYKYTRVPARNGTQKTHTTPQLSTAPPRTLLRLVRRRAPAIGSAGLRNLVLSDPAPGEGE